MNDETIVRLAPMATRLSALSICGESRITDASLATLSGFPHLTQLVMRDTTISDSGIAFVSPSLRTLDLSFSTITDASVQTIAKMPFLTDLSLQVSQSLVRSFISLTIACNRVTPFPTAALSYSPR